MMNLLLSITSQNGENLNKLLFESALDFGKKYVWGGHWGFGLFVWPPSHSCLLPFSFPIGFPVQASFLPSATFFFFFYDFDHLVHFLYSFLKTKLKINTLSFKNANFLVLVKAQFLPNDETRNLASSFASCLTCSWPRASRIVHISSKFLPILFILTSLMKSSKLKGELNLYTFLHESG